MKVLILSQHYWPESFRINEVAASLQGAGCEVSVLTGQPNYPDGKVFPGYRAFRAGREEHEGYTIHRVPLVPRGGGGALRLVANYLSFLASAVAIGPWLLRGRPFDVVFVYGTSPILQAIAGVAIKRLKGAVLVTWVQDLWPESLEATGFVRNRLILDAVAGVVRWIYRRSDLVLVQSETFIEAVASMAGGTPVELHPNPGELAFTHAAAPRVGALALATGFNVVFAGNLGKVQALDTILDAAELCQSLPDTRFVLIGSGSRADWLRREVERRGLRNVQVPGRFAPAEMPAILAQASALLVSLVRSPIMSRTVPSKIQAYFAAGRPVIAALDGEGARIVTEAGAGLACPAEDAGALAAAVRALRAQTPEALRQAGDAGRRYYERHFDPGVLAHRLVHRFQELVCASSRCVRADHAEP
jgi:glycosyltransferase involved in cell wall biosynthesis